MFRSVAAFEFRYQVRSPLAIAAASLFFLAAFADMAVFKLVSVGGGNVLFNSPHSIIVFHLGASLLFLFLGATFVSDVIVRDDRTGFGPLVRATHITKAAYLFGRFTGAFAVGALVLAGATLGSWLGTLMPFANAEMLGPNRLSAFAFGYGLFALPNALIVSAILFALATVTRSTAGTFVGVIGLLVLYFLSQGLLGSQPGLNNVRVLADPLGMSAYMAGARYLTAAEFNAGAVPVTALMVESRLLWIGVSLALLALTYRLFRLTDRNPTRRHRRRLGRPAIPASPTAAVSSMRLPTPHFDRLTASKQFAARAGMEVRSILRSPVFAILLLIAFAFLLPGLLTASGFLGGALYPLTSVLVPIVEASFSTLLIVIATFYGGELVWREHEHRVDGLVDVTPLPAWTLMLPKMLGLALVLVATLLVGVAVAVLVQSIDASVAVSPRDYLLWYLLPAGVDAVVVAALAVFVQALSPSKPAGWGVMVLYLVARLFGPSFGLEHPFWFYGAAPPLPVSDMAGVGNGGAAAWWFRLFWGSIAALLLVATHLLWPRGGEQSLGARLRQVPTRLNRWTRTGAIAAAALVMLSGAWIVWNTLVLNHFSTAHNRQRYLAEYEKRFFRYARLPQPTVRHVTLDVALYPETALAEVRGRYRLVNETSAPIDRVHVRVMGDLALVALALAGARLERDDQAFGYRIYRLDRAMRPGDTRELAFRTRRQQVGFRASGDDTHVVPSGVDLDTLALTPRIGMSDVGMIEDSATRHRFGLPAKQPFPRLTDLAATRVTPGGDGSWTTADITVSTPADQIAVAPGRRVSERVREGRRVARFVPDAPIKNLFPIQAGRFAVRRQIVAGVEHAVYFDPAHAWNVERMMRAMRTSIAYYRYAFGPYQFERTSIVERPFGEGGHAFPGVVAVGESIFALDLRDPEAFDAVSMLVAHELAHQWWGHQVLGARMQGASLLYESLAQYSALMVMKRLGGEARVRRFLRFQLDRYLSGRRTETLPEEPLVRVASSQQHVAYGKGALALYLLQRRIGEATVNRALRRFVDRYRFTVAPYPRSVDLIALLRTEARTPEDQALITDLFERITLYDLRVDRPTAVRRADGRWDVRVPILARKLYADGRGNTRQALLSETIEVGLFAADPSAAGFGQHDVIRTQSRLIHTGRQVVRFVSARAPSHAGIDVDGLHIDRDIHDNIAPIARVSS